MVWMELHVALAVLTFLSFSMRGILMLAGSSWLSHPVVRIAPHVIDTGLLATGIYLMVLIGQYPGTAPWLTAKLLALLAYIVLGIWALRRGKTRAQRGWAFVAALLVFLYIVAVAITRNPLPFFG